MSNYYFDIPNGKPRKIYQFNFEIAGKQYVLCLPAKEYEALVDKSKAGVLKEYAQLLREMTPSAAQDGDVLFMTFWE